ncbi:MAG: hypothetical protein M1812_002491 [Candelaria pacifica]|nr:MAG: hypothetical protein M1812_002491 [Candelaria pacifica]
MAKTDGLEVTGCVAAIVSTYVEAVKALEVIQEQCAANGPTLNDNGDETEFKKMKDSLMLGSTAVQDEYNTCLRRLGKSFATGDQIAKNALKDIIFELQQSLLKRLQPATKELTNSEIAVLNTTSNHCRVTAVAVLEKLHQRLLMAAKIWSVPDGPSTPDSFVFPKTSHGRSSFESSDTNSTGNSMPYGNLTSITTSRPTPQRSSTQGLVAFIKRTGLRRSKTMEHIQRPREQKSAASSKKNIVPKLPAIAIDGTNKSWFDQNGDEKDKAASTIRHNQRLAKSRSKSITGIDDIETYDNDFCLKPWEAVPPPLPSSSSDIGSETSRLKKFTSSTRGILSVPIKRPTTGNRSIISDSTTRSDPLPSPTEHWPSPANNYAGFCKGAYKLQQDMRGAMRLSFRPVGTYTYSEFWKCQKCLFEGFVHGSERAKGFDTRVHAANSGILYRWVFLAKSHAFKGRYGGRGGGDTEWYKCIFCVAEGTTTIEDDQVFSGKEDLMTHLRETHTDRKPSEEILERTKCISGRIADEGEYFELCIPPPTDISDQEKSQQPHVAEADIIDSQLPTTNTNPPSPQSRVVNSSEMEAELLAGQGTTVHTSPENGNLIPTEEPTAQVLAHSYDFKEGVDKPEQEQERNQEEINVQVVDGRIEAVKMVTGQLEDVTGEEFREIWEGAGKVEGVC